MKIYLLIVTIFITVFLMNITSYAQLDRNTKEEITKSIAFTESDTQFNYYNTWEAEDMGRSTGYEIDDQSASNKKAVFASLDVSAIAPMMYGQYVTLSPGKYTAFFRLKANDASNNSPIAILDISYGNGVGKYAEINIFKKDMNDDEYTVIPISFTVYENINTRIEFRVMWQNTADITLDKIDLYSVKGDLPENLISIVKKIPQVEPFGIPNNLTYKKFKFPTKDIFPVSNPISEELTILNVIDLGSDWRTSLTCLQGLVNRDKPKLFLVFNTEDFLWINYLIEKGHIKGFVTENDPIKVFEKYKKYYQGAVITDPEMPHSTNIATMYAAVNDMVVCSPRISKYLKIPVFFETRGKWKTTAEAYNWAYDNLWEKLNHYTASCLWYGVPESRDYLVQHKIFIFWVPGPIDSANIYSDPENEMKFVEKLLEKLPPNTPIMGYPWSGVDIGIGEHGGVGLFAEFGHYLVGSTNGSNMSIHSGTRVKEFKQIGKATHPKLDKNKKYIAITISDGDNLPVLTGFNWPQLWRDPLRGTFPITWTISPASCILLPDIMEYYYSTATPNDSFGAAVSGVGYTYPTLYGTRFKPDDSSKVFDGFIDLTAKYMKKMDLNILFPMNVKKKEIAKFAQKIDFLKGEFPDYGRMHSDYKDTVYLTDKNVPVLHSMSTWDDKVTDKHEQAKRMAKEIREFSPNNGEPAFMHVFMCNWFTDLSVVHEALSILGDEYVPVSAEDLAYLAKNFIEEQKYSITSPKLIGFIEGENSVITLNAQNFSKKTIEIKISASSGFNMPEKVFILKSGIPSEIKIEGKVIDENIELIFSDGKEIRNANIKAISFNKKDIPSEYQNSKIIFDRQFEAEDLPGLIGGILEDKTASGERMRAVTSENSNAGHVVYGPYYQIPAGKYLALFKVKRLDDSNKELNAYVDVCKAGAEYMSKHDLINSELPVGEFVNIFLPFTTKYQPIETRLFWTSGASVALDSVYIFRIE